MAKRSTPMEKAARLLDLVPFLYKNQGISIESLAQEFDVSREEILSDLNTLWMCGESRFDLIELEFDSGYVYIRNAEAINLVRSLSTQEMISIFFGLDLLEEELGDQRPDLKIEIASLKSQINPELSSKVSANPAVSASLLESIDKAISTRSMLEIQYHSIAEDLFSTRVVSPIEKIRRDGQDFLIAFCTAADSLRTFRLDRIRRAEVLNQKSESKEANAEEEVRISVTLQVHGNTRLLKETFDKWIELGNGKFQIEVFNSAWLIREIIASQGDFELLEPVGLRQEVKRQIQATSSQYR
ncbi:COG2378 Predicted transcriptional regulator [Candidatus Nanopelagicaceae bacterium]